ncbi:MAG: cytochrome c oxidase accessory protein CcoG [Bacteroidia bacterium]|nr:cytochrome c oxidase accessory protein CcoG [Bacteroidia bacterium]
MAVSVKKPAGGKSHEPFDPEAFRDSIATVDQTGKRRWIYPKEPSGRLYFWRQVVAYVCIALLFIAPFIKVNGQPMFLFNIIERKFIIFGMTFWPQDFHLFVLSMIAFFVFIVLFTVIFGRIWCGWTCPQTVFMEMVFRRIEYWIEGDNVAQRKLSQAPWNTEKILKRTSKYILFAAISFLIGNLVMAYMIGVDELLNVVLASPLENWGRFTFVMVFSGIFYLVFAYLREQACIAICPYGRLQGVLLSKDSLVVSYDHVRGEPRGKLSKDPAADTSAKGDCIDCKLCVAVCPTGIDIRNGTQLECVNCAACIDACDSIMDRIDKPRGLVRVASYNSIAAGIPFRITPRIIAYSAVLLGLIVVLGFSLGGRSDVETTLLRTPGVLFQQMEDGYISNLYNLQIVNKTQHEYPVTLKLVSPEGRIRMVGKDLVVPSQDIAKGACFIEIPRAALDDRKTEVKIEIWSGDQRIDQVSTNFLGPGGRR